MKQQFDFPPLPDNSRLEVHRHPLGTEIILPWRRSTREWFIDGLAIVLTLALYLGFRQTLVDSIGSNIRLFDLLLVVVLLFNAGRIFFFVMATFKGKRILRFGKNDLQHIIYLPVVGERDMSKLRYRDIRKVKLVDRQGMLVVDERSNMLKFGAGLDMSDLHWLKSALDVVEQEHQIKPGNMSGLQSG